MKKDKRYIYVYASDKSNNYEPYQQQITHSASDYCTELSVLYRVRSRQWQWHRQRRLTRAKTPTHLT